MTFTSTLPAPRSNNQLAQLLMQNRPDYASSKSPMEGLAKMLTEWTGAYTTKNRADESNKALADALQVGMGSPAGLDPKTGINWEQSLPGDRQAMISQLLNNPNTADMGQQMAFGQIGSQMDLENDIAKTKALMPLQLDMERQKKAINDQLSPMDKAKLDLAQKQYELDMGKFQHDKDNPNKPAAVQEFEYYQSLTPDQKKAFIYQKNGGGSNPDIIKGESQLRDEFTKQQKDFVTIRDSYGKVNAAAQNPSPAGDMSMIFGYMKLLDPTSTVREGEYATAQNATGVPSQVTNLYNQILAGHRLNPEQRKDFLGQAKNVYNVQERNYKRSADQYKGLAKQYGYDPSRVVLEMGYQDGQPAKKPSDMSNEELLKALGVQ